jgi:hypothetical protein
MNLQVRKSKEEMGAIFFTCNVIEVCLFSFYVCRLPFFFKGFGRAADSWSEPRVRWH